jgi:RsiW-degrading membrane proteinase PrsW (M82 family)
MSSSLNKFLLLSGCGSLLASIILLLFKHWNLGWQLYLFGIALPVSLTLMAVASNFETGTPVDVISKCSNPWRVAVISICVLLILYHFLAISLAVKFTLQEGFSRLPLELLGYFFLIGFIYTFALLYRVTEPRDS